MSSDRALFLYYLGSSYLDSGRGTRTPKVVNRQMSLEYAYADRVDAEEKER